MNHKTKAKNIVKKKKENDNNVLQLNTLEYNLLFIQ